MNSLAQLQKTRLPTEAGSGAITVERLDGRKGLPVFAADAHEPSIDFPEQRKIEFPNRPKLVHRLDSVGSKDRLTHAKDGGPGQRAVVPFPKKIQFVEGDGLRIQVEHGVGMGKRCVIAIERNGGSSRPPSDSYERTPLRVRCTNELHVPAGAPCSAGCAHCVEVPTHTPVMCVLGPYEGASETESILRGHASRRDVQRMISK